MKTLWFDMDGTVANLYNRENWLEDLRAERPGVFADLEPMVNMDELRRICNHLIAQGWKIGIITWLPMGASKDYEQVCAMEKEAWVKKWMPYVQEFHAQTYGVPKQAAVKRSSCMILVDDNKEVCQTWDTRVMRKHICAKTTNILNEIWKLRLM